MLALISEWRSNKPVLSRNDQKEKKSKVEEAIFVKMFNVFGYEFPVLICSTWGQRNMKQSHCVFSQCTILKW